MMHSGPVMKTENAVYFCAVEVLDLLFILQTQKHVRVYDLAKQELVKKLYSNSKWISSIAIHPGNSITFL
jgi:ribosome biogenesis protein ERB1